MANYQYVLYEKKGHIASVTINRPEVMNALHADANIELSEVFTDFKEDDNAWIAILTGARPLRPARAARGPGGGGGRHASPAEAAPAQAGHGPAAYR